MYPNPAEAHSGIWLHDIVKDLQKKGYQFQVAFSVPTPPFPFSLIKKWNKFSRQFPIHHNIDGVPIDFLRYYTSYKLIPYRHQGTAYMLSQTKHLRHIIKDFNPNMLWAQPSLPNGWAAMKISKSMNIPYVVAVHGADINVSANLPGGVLKLKQIYESATSVVSISQRLNREVNNIAPLANRKLVYFGINPDSFKQAREIRQQFLRSSKMDESLRVLSVSNLIKSKGIQYNFQAVSKLVDKYPKIEYTIVGDGVYLSELKKYAFELNVSDNIRFVGRINHDKALGMMAQTDIFALPSYLEGMGMVYLEAMALGVPVIGIRGQGIEEVIDHNVNGILIEPHDSNALANAIEQLITDSALSRKIGLAARNHIYENFAWNTTCEQFDKIFRETITK